MKSYLTVMACIFVCWHGTGYAMMRGINPFSKKKEKISPTTVETATQTLESSMATPPIYITINGRLLQKNCTTSAEALHNYEVFFAALDDARARNIIHPGDSYDTLADRYRILMVDLLTLQALAALDASQQARLQKIIEIASTCILVDLKTITRGGKTAPE